MLLLESLNYPDDDAYQRIDLSEQQCKKEDNSFWRFSLLYRIQWQTLRHDLWWIKHNHQSQELTGEIAPAVTHKSQMSGIIFVYC